MKITYDMQEEEQRDVVAFIDEDGHLCLRSGINDCVVVGSDEVSISSIPFNDLIANGYATKLFYRGSGDSVTITF